MAKSIYHTGHWRRLRKRVVARCGGKCERCGRELAGAGHLHHLTYERAGQELEGDVEMICLLCHGTDHPKHTFVAPSLLARYREWAITRPYQRKVRAATKARHQGKHPKKKAPQPPRVEEYWDEINGEAYAKAMSRLKR